MRVLITGGAGFIGSHLVQAWEDKADVIVLDNFRTGFERNLIGRKCRLVNGSIEDRDLVRELMQGIDYVFNMAALVSVPESVSNPRATLALNVLGLLNVLDAAVESGVKKVVFSSSAAVYGNNPSVPKLEEMVPEPLSPYAITKLDGEHYLEFYRREFGLQTVALRFFNVFGPRQDPNGAYAAAVPIFISKAISGDPITIFGDGEQTRDFVFVKDIVGANLFVCAEAGAIGVYNVGYGKSISINDLAQSINERFGNKSPILHREERPGDVKHSLASADKLMKLGWKPRFSVGEGLDKTIAYYTKQSDC